MAAREDTKSTRDGGIENLRDDHQSSSTQPATSSPHYSRENDGDDSDNGQRPSNTPHETSTPVISGSSAPRHDNSPASDGDGDRSAAIAPPSTITQKAFASIINIWGFLYSLWKNRVIRLICTSAYAYLFYKISPLRQDFLSTMTLFLLFHWIIQSLFKNTGSIFLLTIAILWLLWLVHAILVDLNIVEAVKSIYLTSNKARLWQLVLQTLKVMFVDSAVFIGGILRALFDYIRYRLSRSGQGPVEFQLLPEDMLVPT